MKNRFSIHQKLLNFVLALGMIFTMPMAFCGQQPAAMPELSPEQMEELQQELAKINDEMQAFVKTLPPEKQQEIAELEEAINKMSDEELEQLFEQLFTDENFLKELEQMYPEQSAEEAPIEAEPTYEPAPIEKPIEKPKVEKNRIALAAEMIKNLTETTDAFLAKLDAIPEIDDLVRNWIKKNKVHGWKQNIAWHDIKAQIELLNHKLKKMLYKEAGTNEYRFLPDLINEEALYNNLAHMEQILKINVPKIEVAVFGLKKVGKASKATMRSVLNKYAEGMSDLQIIPAINSVIEKHEPIAKQLRDKEEAQTKKALEESKKPRTEKTMVIAGKPEQRPSPVSTNYPDYGGYYPSSGFQPSYTPSYKPSESSSEAGTGKPSAAGGAGVGKGGVAGGKEEKKDGKEEKKGDKDKTKETKKDSKKKKTKAEEQFETVVKKLKDANKVVSDPLIFDIRANIHKPGPVPAELAGLMEEAVNKINAATGAVNDLGKTLADQSQKEQRDYRNKVKSAFSKQAPALHHIDYQLENFIKKNLKSIKKTANPTRLKAYGLDFDAKQPQVAATSMDADVDQNVPLNDQGGANPEDVLAQAQREQAGVPAEERADVPSSFAKASPFAKASADRSADRQDSQPKPKAAPAPVPAQPEAPAQAKGKPEAPAGAPRTLDAAIAALKDAIEKLVK